MGSHSKDEKVLATCTATDRNFQGYWLQVLTTDTGHIYSQGYWLQVLQQILQQVLLKVLDTDIYYRY